MARKINITISDVNKKHLKVILYLMVSAALAYLLSIIANKPEAIYLTPVINYILFAIKQEQEKAGYIEAIRNERK